MPKIKFENEIEKSRAQRHPNEKFKEISRQNRKNLFSIYIRRKQNILDKHSLFRLFIK